MTAEPVDDIRVDKQKDEAVAGPPVFRWPSERRLIPERCATCRARLVVSDVPTAGFPRTDVTCLLCSRTACELRLDGTERAPLRALAPEPVKRGRPPGPPAPAYRSIPEPPSRPHRPMRPCPDCGDHQISGDAACCWECHRARVDAGSQTTRLIDLLSDGRAYTRAELCAAIVVSPDGLRHVVRKARQRGYTIVRERDRYRMTLEPTAASLHSFVLAWERALPFLAASALLAGAEGEP